MIKARLLGLLHEAYTDEQNVLADLTAAEREAVGIPERWAIKDQVVHIAASRRREVDRVAAVRRKAPPPDFGDIEQLNAAQFRATRALAWPDIVAHAQAVFDALVTDVSALSDDDLSHPPPFAPAESKPLWVYIAGGGYGHPEAHLAEIYLQRGDLPQATEIQERATATLTGLASSPALRGGYLYLLARFYATTGQTTKARLVLREVLGLNPDLARSAAEDSVMAPLLTSDVD